MLKIPSVACIWTPWLVENRSVLPPEVIEMGPDVVVAILKSLVPLITLAVKEPAAFKSTPEMVKIAMFPFVWSSKISLPAFAKKVSERKMEGPRPKVDLNKISLPASMITGFALT